MKYKIIVKENKELTSGQYLKELNKLLDRSAQEVNKDLKILINIKNKAAAGGDFIKFWVAVNKILQKEKQNAAKLSKIFPGIFDNLLPNIATSIEALANTAKLGDEIRDVDTATTPKDKDSEKIDYFSPLCVASKDEDPDIEKLFNKKIALSGETVVDENDNVLLDFVQAEIDGIGLRDVKAIKWLLKNKRFPNLHDLADPEIFLDTDLVRGEDVGKDLARILGSQALTGQKEDVITKLLFAYGGGLNSALAKLLLPSMKKETTDFVVSFFKAIEKEKNPATLDKLRNETPKFCTLLNRLIKNYILSFQTGWQQKSKLKFINKAKAKKIPGFKMAYTTFVRSNEQKEAVLKAREEIKNLKATVANLRGDANAARRRGDEVTAASSSSAAEDFQDKINKLIKAFDEDPKYVTKYWINPYKKKQPNDGLGEIIKPGDPRENISKGQIKSREELRDLEKSAVEWKKTNNINENLSFEKKLELQILENKNQIQNIDNLLDALTSQGGQISDKAKQKIINNLRKQTKIHFLNVDSTLKRNEDLMNRFKHWLKTGLNNLRKKPDIGLDLKKQHPTAWPIIFFVQNQQYVESLQTIYSILALITAFRDDMVKLATAVDTQFTGVTKAVGSKVPRLPADSERVPGDPVIQEAAEMVDAPEIEMNPAAAVDEPEKQMPSEIIKGLNNIEQFYEKVYDNFNLEQVINKSLKDFKDIFILGLLGKSSSLLKSLDMAKRTAIGTSKKQGIYENLLKENCIITNNSNVDVSQLENIVARFYPYVKEKLKFDKDAKLKFISDPENAKDPWGKTAYYNPNSMEITIFVDGRHPKDMLRSISHELVHHAQNCRGEFDKTQTVEPGYAQKDPHMRRMEGEAYLLGNGFLVRDFEDYIKSQRNQNLTENKKMKGLTNEQLRTVLENTIKRVMNEDGFIAPTGDPAYIGEEEVVEETEETLEEEVVEEKKEGKKGAHDDGDDEDERCDHVPCNESFTSKKDQLLFERLTNKWAK